MTSMFKNGMKPIHPGEILREEFMLPLGLSSAYLAEKLNVKTALINGIEREEIGINEDTALRLSIFFDTHIQYWNDLQDDYELRLAEIKS